MIAFENKNINSDLADQIPDQDLLFLKKEVARYKASIMSLIASKDATLEDSINVDNLKNDPEFVMGPE